MSAIHEITEDWQREGLSPTWVKLQRAKAEHDALTAEVAELREKLAKKAELLRGCYAADHKQKQRIAELEDEKEKLHDVLAGVLLMGRGISGRIIIEGWQEEVIRAALKEDKTC